jgi:hypothetical protein
VWPNVQYTKEPSYKITFFNMIENIHSNMVGAFVTLVPLAAASATRVLRGRIGAR